MAVLVSGADVARTPPFPGADTFLQKNCAACHNGRNSAGRLDLTSLGYDPANPDNFELWVKIHDRVAEGEMPPRGLPRPASDSLAQFTTGLAGSLTSYEHAVSAQRGRAGLRRLNAYEYENAIRDLLDVPWAQIKGKLPQDGEAFRYNKVGGALDVSHVQLSRYMSSADYALKEAMTAKLIQPPTTVTRIYARQEPSLRNYPPARGQHPHRPSEFPRARLACSARCAGRARPNTSPETKEQEAVAASQASSPMRAVSAGAASASPLRAATGSG